MDKKIINSKIKILMCFIFFGIVGVISAFIPLSSYALVFYRALFASVFLLLAVIIMKKEYRVELIKQNILKLIFAGCVMGFNWVFMFLSMKTSSISVGTVCYNSSPIFMIIIASFLLKEKINIKSIICIILGILGVVLVSDIIYTGMEGNVFLGVVLGIIGAILYGLVVIFNKKMYELNSYEKISIEFLVTTVIMVPFILLDNNSSFLFGHTDNYILSLFLLVVLSVFITGYIYVVYFDSVNDLPSRVVAVATYIDPVVALVLSHFILKETLNFTQVCGTILILLATIINEFVDSNKDLQ